MNVVKGKTQIDNVKVDPFLISRVIKKKEPPSIFISAIKNGPLQRMSKSPNLVKNSIQTGVPSGRRITQIVQSKKLASIQGRKSLIDQPRRSSIGVDSDETNKISLRPTVKNNFN